MHVPDFILLLLPWLIFCKRRGAKAEGQTSVEPPGNQADGWGEGWGGLRAWAEHTST